MSKDSSVCDSGDPICATIFQTGDSVLMLAKLYEEASNYGHHTLLPRGITDELNSAEFTIDPADCLAAALTLIDDGDGRKYLWRLSVDATLPLPITPIDYLD